MATQPPDGPARGRGATGHARLLRRGRLPPRPGPGRAAGPTLAPSRFVSAQADVRPPDDQVTATHSRGGVPSRPALGRVDHAPSGKADQRGPAVVGRPRARPSG